MGLIKTAIHGRWNRHSSKIEEAKALWRIRKNFDKGKVASGELKLAEDSLTERFLRLLEDIGIDMISDGGFRYDSAFDISRGFGSCSGFNTLHRVSNTNHFHRAPEIYGLPKWQKPILVEDAKFLRVKSNREILVSLVGPYTLARQSIIRNPAITFEKLVEAFSLALNSEIRQLHKIPNIFVKIDEPQIIMPAPRADWELVKSSHRALTEKLDKERLFLASWFGPIRNPKEYFSLPFGGFFLDMPSLRFAWRSAKRVRKPEIIDHIPPKKVVCVGLIDATQPYLENDDLLKSFLELFLKKLNGNYLILSPNTDLTFLPWDITETKLRQLIRIAKEAA